MAVKECIAWSKSAVCLALGFYIRLLRAVLTQQHLSCAFQSNTLHVAQRLPDSIRIPSCFLWMLLNITSIHCRKGHWEQEHLLQSKWADNPFLATQVQATSRLTGGHQQGKFGRSDLFVEQSCLDILSRGDASSFPVSFMSLGVNCRQL